MLKLTPIVRTLLTGLAAAIGVIAAVADTLPIWAQAIIVGASVILAGVGIIPPHVATATVATDATDAPAPLYPPQSYTTAEWVTTRDKAAKYDELREWFTPPEGKA